MKWATLVWCFLMGLSIDAFSNTPGLATSSMTLMGLLQPYLLELYVPRDAEEDMKAAASTLGFGKFVAMASIMVVIYCVVFFTLEAFSFFNWLHWLKSIGGSVLLTLVFVITLESVRK